MKNSDLVPVMLVRVPEMSKEMRASLKAEIESSIYDGVLLLDESLPYEVVELPLPRDSPVAQEAEVAVSGDHATAL